MDRSSYRPLEATAQPVSRISPRKPAWLKSLQPLKNRARNALPLSMYTTRGNFPNAMQARRKALAIQATFSVAITSQPKGQALRPSKNSSRVMRVGLPVSGLIVSKLSVCPSAITTSPTSTSSQLRRMARQHLSFHAFFPSRKSVHWSKLVCS